MLTTLSLFGAKYSSLKPNFELSTAYFLFLVGMLLVCGATACSALSFLKSGDAEGASGSTAEAAQEGGAEEGAQGSSKDVAKSTSKTSASGSQAAVPAPESS